MVFQILWLFPVFHFVNAQIIVNTTNGVVQGKVEYSQRGTIFYAFQQIPYAKPPVGPLRFKAPVPVDNWEGVYDATQDNKICFQQSDSYSSLENEDCLFVNVYSPVYPPPREGLPVMVWIHGGGFVYGGANFNSYGPHYWMEHNVIIVTIAYRLTAFGFLTTGDTVLPGNNGLKDQNLALRWVRDNIESFGGDANKVTIFGQSAGGASVQYHLLSEKSRGLFRAAISLSGSTLCPWSFQRNYKFLAYHLASILNPNFDLTSSSEELMEFLQSVPAEDIRAATRKFPQEWYNRDIIDGFLFTPVIETDHEDAFITKRMHDVIESGGMQRVPIIIGITSEEMVWNALDLESFQWTASWLDTNLTALVNGNMRINDTDEKVEVGDAIRKIYTNDSFQNNIGDAVQFFSDTSFGRPIIQHAKLQSRFSEVYFYRFSYTGTLPGERPYIEGAYNVAHGDDINYVWVYGNNSNLDSYPKSDVLQSERYRILLSNFAKTLMDKFW